MSVYGFDGSAWRKAKGVWAFDGSAWRKAKDVWGFDGSSWRKAVNSKTTSTSGALGWVQKFKYGNQNHTSGWNANGNCYWGAWRSYKNYIGWTGMRWTSIANYSIISSISSCNCRVARGSSSSGLATPLRLAACSSNYNSSSATSAFSNCVSTNRYTPTDNLPAGNNTWRNVYVQSGYLGTLATAVRSGNYLVTSVNSTNNDYYCSIIDTLSGSTSFTINYTYTVSEFALLLNYESMFNSTRTLDIPMTDEQLSYMNIYNIDGKKYGYIYLTEQEKQLVYGGGNIFDNSYKFFDPRDIFDYRERYKLPNHRLDRFVGEGEKPFIQDLDIADNGNDGRFINITAYNVEPNQMIEFSINGNEWKSAMPHDSCNFRAKIDSESIYLRSDYLEKRTPFTVKSRIINKKDAILQDARYYSEDTSIDYFEKKIEVGGLA